MNWVIALWSALIGACAAMALPHLLVGLRERRGPHLFFVLASGAVIGIAVMELAMMGAKTTTEFGRALQLVHIPVFMLVVAIVGIVQLYLRTGRRWLGLTVCGLRFVTLVINFAVPPNLNFRQITALRPLEFLGQTVATPIGVLSPWTRLAELSSFLLLVYVGDASLRLWRKGDPESRRRVLTVGGTVALCIFLAAGVTALINRQVLQMPNLISFPFALFLVGMAFELGSDLFHAGQVAKQLRASKASLRETEERIALAAEAAQLGVWELNPETNEMWVSDRVRALFQIDEHTLSYEKFRERVHPEDRAARDKLVRHAIDSQGGYETEFRIVLPDGGLRWIGGRARWLSYQDNKRRLLGVSIDISARKAAEEEARQRREQIELLGRASVLGEMTASLAHELNQPLTAVTTNADSGIRFIEKGNVDPTELREILEDIGEAGRRADDIVQGVRRAIKKGSVVHGKIDLNQLVETVVHLMQPEAVAQSCEVEMALAENLPPVEGDPGQLQQVLINLVSNGLHAVRDMAPGRRKLRISTHFNGDGSVVVGVRDHGHGIPDAAREHLFEQFFTTKEEGLGMGLAIVRSIVEAHRGKIEVENATGGGAHFRFEVPSSEK